jgi:magnesium transporter
VQPEEPMAQPWTRLEELAADGDRRGAEELLLELPPGETARAFANLQRDAQRSTLALLAPGASANVLESLPDAQAADLLDLLEPATAAAIMNELPSNAQADLLSLLAEDRADVILANMEPEEARTARRLAAYPGDLAGGLMITEFLHYPAHATVQDVVDDIRAQSDRYASYDVQYAYVTARDGRLVGVLALRNLLLSAARTPVRSLMIEKPLRVSVEATLDELRAFFEEHPFVGVPVVANRGTLVGVVRRANVLEALEDRSESDHLKTQGIVGGEELRTMSVFLRSRRRLSWLSVNIVLNLIAASVIALYQETLQAVIALAVFLPIISDMSGCSGNQAVAVSMRELTLGLIRPMDVTRVWLKEASVGLLNGAALGSLIAAAAWAWQGNPYLGAVVGAAMAINTLIAVSLGGVVPLLLRRLRVDPALASGPILTTVTDMCGFALVLGIATAFLPLLTHS